MTTNNTPQVFHFTDSLALRGVVIDGAPWFVAADICQALGLTNPTKALLSLDEDEQALTTIQGLSRGNDQANIVNESGLYSLIFKSRKPAARQFKKWVTAEVLPSIRKTGSYSNQVTTKQQSEIQSAVHAYARSNKQAVPAVWRDLHQHFDVPRYAELSADQFQAVMWWLSGAPYSQLLSVSRTNLLHLSSNAMKLCKSVEQVLPALRALESPLASALVSYQHEVISAASAIERKFASELDKERDMQGHLRLGRLL